jgi:hypothetical protein
LHILREQYGYRFYWHFYSFQRKQGAVGGEFVGVHKMGLAILVPERIYNVEKSAQLRPWQDSDMKVTDCVQIGKLEESISKLDEFQKKCADSDKKAGVTDEMWAQLHGLMPREAKIILGPLLGKINKEKSALRKKVDAIVTEYTRRPPSYNDRSVLLLKLSDIRGRSFVVGNIHIPCKFSAPKIMTSIALKAKQCIVDWLRRNGLNEVPMLLCGDFNATPGDNVHSCFTGGLQFEDPAVNTDYVEFETFEKVVSDEPWLDLLKRFNTGGCTNYGFTRQGYGDRYEKLKAYMDSLGPDFAQLVDAVMAGNEADGAVLSYRENYPDVDVSTHFASAITMRKTLFVPNQLMLDHFFSRGRFEDVEPKCWQSWELASEFGGRPLPDLDFGEPSDHLAISVDFK